MNRDYKTKAIILKKRGGREADLLFSIWTEDYGKVEAMAQGARKNVSKLAGHLSVPGIVEINFVRGKAFFRLTHAFMSEPWKLQNDADFLFYSAILEVLDKTLKEGDSNEKIWKLSVWICEHIFSAEKFSQKLFVFSVFLIKLLGHLGYDLNAESCGKCGKDADNDMKYDFSNNKFYCGKCSTAGRAVSIRSIEIINATKKPQAINMRLTQGELRSLFAFLADYLEYYVERKFNGLNHLR